MKENSGGKEGKGNMKTKQVQMKGREGKGREGNEREREREQRSHMQYMQTAPRPLG